MKSLVIALFFTWSNLFSAPMAQAQKPFKKIKFESTKEYFFKVKGKKYYLRTTKNVNGKITRQVTLGPNYVQIKEGLLPNGRFENWEVHKAGMEVQASHPTNKGQYQSLTIKKKTAKSWVTVEYFLSKRLKRYIKVSQKSEPFRKMAAQVAYEDLRVTCNPNENPVEQLSGSFQDLLRRVDLDEDLKNSDSIAAEILIAKESIFDRSCTKKGTGAVLKTGELEMLAKAMGKVMGSKNSDPKSYLSCLNDHGLGVHAARIEGRFYSGLLDKANSGELGCYNKNLISCQPHDPTEPNLFGQYDSRAGSITMVMNKNLHNCPLDDPGIGPQQLKISSPIEHKKKMLEKTFFHEMIHASGIQDEYAVHALTDCCGDPQDKDSNACKRVDTYISDRLELFKARSDVYDLFNFGSTSEWMNQQSSDVIGTLDLQNKITLGYNEIKEAADENFSACFNKGIPETICNTNRNNELKTNFPNMAKEKCEAAEVSGLDCSALAAQIKRDIVDSRPPESPPPLMSPIAEDNSDEPKSQPTPDFDPNSESVGKSPTQRPDLDNADEPTNQPPPIVDPKLAKINQVPLQDTASNESKSANNGNPAAEDQNQTAQAPVISGVAQCPAPIQIEDTTEVPSYTRSSTGVSSGPPQPVDLGEVANRDDIVSDLGGTSELLDSAEELTKNVASVFLPAAAMASSSISLTQADTSINYSGANGNFEKAISAGSNSGSGTSASGTARKPATAGSPMALDSRSGKSNAAPTQASISGENSAASSNSLLSNSTGSKMSGLSGGNSPSATKQTLSNGKPAQSRSLAQSNESDSTSAVSNAPSLNLSASSLAPTIESKPDIVLKQIHARKLDFIKLLIENKVQIIDETGKAVGSISPKVTYQYSPQKKSFIKIENKVKKAQP